MAIPVYCLAMYSNFNNGDVFLIQIGKRLVVELRSGEVRTSLGTLSSREHSIPSVNVGYTSLGAESPLVNTDLIGGSNVLTFVLNERDSFKIPSRPALVMSIGASSLTVSTSLGRMIVALGEVMSAMSVSTLVLTFIGLGMGALVVMVLCPL